MPRATVNGQSIYFEDTGGDNPAVVFSHGLLMDHRMFAPQVAALHSDFRCIVWDERGHGGTGDATAPFSYYDSADDLVALLDHLEIKQAVFAGMSQGGYLSLRAALRHADRIRALVLIDTQAGPEDPAKMPLYEQLIHRWSTQGMDDELAGIITHIILGDGFADAPLWQAQWKRQTPANLQLIFQTLASRDDIRDAVASIRKPTLVIHGEQDNAIAFAEGEWLAKKLGGELVRVPGGGHAANLSHPQIVNPPLLRFLHALDG